MSGLFDPSSRFNGFRVATSETVKTALIYLTNP
jgi:hypothetical protein